MAVCTIENRGKRNFVISAANHVSGGQINKDPNGGVLNVSILPDTIVKVTLECGKKLAKEWSREIRILSRSASKKKE